MQAAQRYIKEEFYKILDSTNRADAKELMSEWIMAAQASILKDYKDCATTLQHWSTFIDDTKK